MSGGSDWCVRCHHMIWRADDGFYLHVSDDDWAGGECGCATCLTRCVPESVYARWAAAVRSVTSAVIHLTGTVTIADTVTIATGAYAGLADAVKQEDS